MPTYEYVCQACGHEMEEFQSMSAKPLRKCPKCGKQKLKRLIGTGAGIIFKGSGFYQTDYRSDSYTKSAEADKKPVETTAEKPAETKSESKPALAAEKKTEKKEKPAKKSESK